MQAEKRLKNKTKATNKLIARWGRTGEYIVRLRNISMCLQTNYGPSSASR